MVSLALNHLWQSTLFAALAALLCHLLRNDSARARYWLWWAASIKFLIPFSLLTKLGQVLAGNSVILNLPDTWSTAAELIAQPLPASDSISTFGILFIAIWVIGSAVVLSRQFRGAAQLRRLIAAADQDAVSLNDRGHRIPVCRTGRNIEPGVTGFFRPVLILPKGIEKQLSNTQLSAVIAHELCHIRRHDNLTAATHRIVESVFWFYPLIWWIGARLVEEREKACDEMVVAQGHDPTAYADAILNICELYIASPAPCAIGASECNLVRRIKIIMQEKKMTTLIWPKRLLLSAVGVSTIAIPILAGVITQRSALAQQVEEYLPIVKVAPIYPEEAAAIGLEGYVIVEFTVTETGAVTDISVIESTSNIFDESAIAATTKFKYQPRTVNGSPVPVPGVRNRITFLLEQPRTPE